MLAIKFAEGDDNLIEGWGMPFGGPHGGQDLADEHFSDRTSFCFDWYPDRPVLYQHGLDAETGTAVIGRVKSWTKKDLGVWVQAQLDAHSEYVDSVKELIRQGVLSFSSGAMAHLVRKDAKSGEIKVWPWVELSVTPTPCNLLATLDFATAAKHFKSAGLDLPDEDALKAKLDADARNSLDDGDFAYIDAAGGRHLPMHDECLVGETLIPLLDGRIVPISSLVNEEEFWVYSFDLTANAVVAGRGHSARLTRTAEVIVRVTLDNGEVVECTTNHPFLLRAGEYRMAQDLSVGDSVMPLYRKIENVHDKPYEKLYQPFYRFWELTSHAIDRSAHGRLVDGNVVHHHNDDQFDNRPVNLQQMTRAMHCSYHGEQEKRGQREHLKRALEARWAKPGAREKAAERRRRANLEAIAVGCLPFRKSPMPRRVSDEAAKMMHPRYLAGESISALARELDAGDYHNLRRAFDRNGLPLRQEATSLVNHKVVRIEFCERATPVYDLSVDGLHNFALASGVFVHNSHVRAALARFDQTDFESEEAKAKAKRKLMARAKEMGVEVGDDKKIVNVVYNMVIHASADSEGMAKKIAEDFAALQMLANAQSANFTANGDTFKWTGSEWSSLPSDATKLASTGMPDHEGQHDKPVSKKPTPMAMMREMAKGMDMSDEEMEAMLAKMGDMAEMDEEEMRKRMAAMLDEQMKAKKPNADECKAVSFEEVRQQLERLVNESLVATNPLLAQPSTVSEAWGYVECTYADHAIFKLHRNGEERIFRIPYTLGADGNVAGLGQPEEVEEIYVPVGEAQRPHLPMGMHADIAKFYATSLLESTRDLHERRVKEGRTLSTGNRRQIGDTLSAMREACDRLQTLLDSTETKPRESGAEAARAKAVRLRLRVFEMCNSDTMMMN